MGDFSDPHIFALLGVGRRVCLALGDGDVEDVGVISAVLAGPNGPAFIVLDTGSESRGYFIHAIRSVTVPWDGQRPVEHPGMRTT